MAGPSAALARPGGRGHRPESLSMLPVRELLGRLSDGRPRRSASRTRSSAICSWTATTPAARAAALALRRLPDLRGALPAGARPLPRDGLRCAPRPIRRGDGAARAPGAWRVFNQIFLEQILAGGRLSEVELGVDVQPRDRATRSRTSSASRRLLTAREDPSSPARRVRGPGRRRGAQGRPS